MTTTSVLPGLVDAHVHLGLVNYPALVGSPVVEVHDLGWLPGSVEGWRREIGSSVEVRAAGPFHAAPGGYPHGRSWAPEGSVREITDAESARQAVSAAVAANAHTFKVTLHTGGPRLDRDLLHTLVRTAHAADLTVSAHAEGAGQANEAAEAGVDVLVHAPWTETLDQATLRRMAGKVSWISTFAIHEAPQRQVALDNARRFLALGGEMRYGTDMGNGPTPVGVNEAEILLLGEAGLSGDRLLTALTGVLNLKDASPERLLHSKRPLPHTAAEYAEWFSTAEVSSR